jgi:hypothetical protein
MKKVIILMSVIALVSGNAYSQNKEYEKDKVAICNFLVKHCSYKDDNPTHQEDADEVNFFVREILWQQYTPEKIPDLITQALQLFYDNSIGTFEDAADVYRMSRRRSLCYMALTFLSDDCRYPAFLEDARQTLSKLASDLNGKMLLMVDATALYKQLNSKYLPPENTDYYLSLYQDNLKNREKHISDKDFIAEYRKILSDITNAFSEKLK